MLKMVVVWSLAIVILIRIASFRIRLTIVTTVVEWVQRASFFQREQVER